MQCSCQCMFRPTARVLSGPLPSNRPNNYKHPFIFILSRTERKARVFGDKEKYNHPLTLNMRDEHVSRTMTYLLRHKAVEEGLSMRPDGYVRVPDLVCLVLWTWTNNALRLNSFRYRNYILWTFLPSNG